MLFKDKIKKREEFLIYLWNNPWTVTSTEEPHWWEFWKPSVAQKRDLGVASKYIIEIIDEFLRMLLAETQETYENGKQVIIESLTSIYNEIVSLPWYLKPFYNGIRNILMTIVIPMLLDYLWKTYIVNTNEQN